VLIGKPVALVCHAPGVLRHTKGTDGKDWEPHVVQDGLLITGQNPASSAEAARRLIQALNKPVP
jgi:putative intracellular protease/amidase